MRSGSTIDYDWWLQKSAGCFDDDDCYEPSVDEVYDYWVDNYLIKGEEPSVEYFLSGDLGTDSFVALAEQNESFIRDYESGIVEDIDDWFNKDPDGHATAFWNKVKPVNGKTLCYLLNSHVYDSKYKKGTEWDDLYDEAEEYYTESKLYDYEEGLAEARAEALADREW